MGVLIAAGQFGNTEEYKSRFTRSELNSTSVGYAHLRLPTKKKQTINWFYDSVPLRARVIKYRIALYKIYAFFRFCVVVRWKWGLIKQSVCYKVEPLRLLLELVSRFPKLVDCSSQEGSYTVFQQSKHLLP